MDQSNSHGHDPITDQVSSKYAPWYHVPELSMVCIDHPFIVENIEKAFDTLGGLPKIRSVYRPQKHKPSFELTQISVYPRWKSRRASESDFTPA